MEKEKTGKTKDSRKSGLCCIIKTCKRSYRDTTEDFPVRLFKFPTKENLRREWKFKCKLRRDFNVDNAQICNIHFESKYLGGKKLKTGAVPTLRLTEEPSLNLNMTDKSIAMDSFQDEIVEEISAFQSSPRKNPPKEPSNAKCINELINNVGFGGSKLKPGAMPPLYWTVKPSLNLNMTDKSIAMDSFQDGIVEEISAFQSSPRKNPPEKTSNAECNSEFINNVEKENDPVNEVEDEEPYDPKYEFCPNCYKKEKNEAYYRSKYWQANTELNKGKEMINKGKEMMTKYRKMINILKVSLRRDRMLKQMYSKQKSDYRNLCRILNKKVLKQNKIISKWHEAARDP